MYKDSRQNGEWVQRYVYIREQINMAWDKQQKDTWSNIKKIKFCYFLI